LASLLGASPEKTEAGQPALAIAKQEESTAETWTPAKPNTRKKRSAETGSAAAETPPPLKHVRTGKYGLPAPTRNSSEGKAALFGAMMAGSSAKAK